MIYCIVTLKNRDLDLDSKVALIRSSGVEASARSYNLGSGQLLTYTIDSTEVDERKRWEPYSGSIESMDFKEITP